MMGLASIGINLLTVFGFAIRLVLLLGVALHVERQRGELFVPAMPLLMCVGIAASTLLSGRNLALADKHIALLSSDAGGGTVIQQAITLCILAAAIAKVFGRFVLLKALPTKPGTPLFMSLASYYFLSTLLPSALGTKPVFIHSLFYPILIFAAAWCARNEPLAHTLIAAKAGVYALMCGSLVAAVVWPSGALQPDYIGLIPGLHVRLWGLGSNANSIGPLALLALMLEVLQPTHSKPLRYLLVLAASSVFVLAQSKTVWVALLLVVALVMWQRHRHDIVVRHQMVLLVFSLFVLSLMLLALLFFDVTTVWDRMVGSKLGESLSSLTGRTTIWSVAIHTWEESPWFGYGPTAWNADFRDSIGLAFAFSAHNQFLQTLSVSGLFGFVALLVYLVFLVTAAWRLSDSTRGISLALLAMVLFRCLAEAPLSMVGLLDGDTLTHFVLFCLLLRAPPPSTAYVRRSNAAQTP